MIKLLAKFIAYAVEGLYTAVTGVLFLGAGFAGILSLIHEYLMDLANAGTRHDADN